MVAYQNGGGLLKFGGDALLIWFHGADHAERACRSTVLMRRVLYDRGHIELRDAQVTLSISQGVHSGLFHFFAVGTSHVEFLPAGPAWTRLTTMERGADAGEIVVSQETAALLAAGCVGDAKGPGLLPTRAPGCRVFPVTDPPPVPPQALAHCLSPALRAHVLGGGGALSTTCHDCVHPLRGTDALIEKEGPAAVAESASPASAVEQPPRKGRIFLASDVDSVAAS
jgi:hypothetical protein